MQCAREPRKCSRGETRRAPESPPSASPSAARLARAGAGVPRARGGPRGAVDARAGPARLPPPAPPVRLRGGGGQAGRGDSAGGEGTRSGSPGRRRHLRGRRQGRAAARPGQRPARVASWGLRAWRLPGGRDAGARRGAGDPAASPLRDPAPGLSFPSRLWAHPQVRNPIGEPDLAGKPLSLGAETRSPRTHLHSLVSWVPPHRGTGWGTYWVSASPWGKRGSGEKMGRWGDPAPVLAAPCQRGQRGLGAVRVCPPRGPGDCG